MRPYSQDMKLPSQNSIFVPPCSRDYSSQEVFSCLKMWDDRTCDGEHDQLFDEHHSNSFSRDLRILFVIRSFRLALLYWVIHLSLN